MKKFLLIFALSALAVESTIATNQIIQKKLAETIGESKDINILYSQSFGPDKVVTTTSTITPGSTQTAQGTQGALITA